MELTGKAVAVTGVIPGMTRQEVARAIEARGGVFVAREANRADILVQGEKPHHYGYGKTGKKTAVARMCGIPIVGFAELLEALGGSAC